MVAPSSEPNRVRMSGSPAGDRDRPIEERPEGVRSGSQLRTVLTIRRRPGQAPPDHSRQFVTDLGSRVSRAEDSKPLFAVSG